MPLGIHHSPPRPAPSFARRAAALAAAGLAAACGGKQEAKAPPPPEVSVTEVIARDVPVGAELTGTLKGNVDIEIRARVEGFLKSIDYEEGAMVKKGQLLFTIDDQPYRAKLAEAKGDLARAESTLSKATLDVRRYTPLAAQRAVPQAELDNAIALQRSAKAQVDAARANVRNAEINLGYTRLSSPIDGLAGQAQRKVGDLVGKPDPTLLTVVSTIDPVRVSVNLPEALYLKAASELQLSGKAPAGPSDDRPGAQLVLGDGTVYPERGYLVLVDRAVDPTTGTLHAELAFRNPKRLLRPGLYAKVQYREELRRGALLVPQVAVQELQGQYSVVVVNAEGKAETRKVKVGPRYGNQWVIDDGVKAGERVVVEGLQKTRDGMLVKATAAPPGDREAAAGGTASSAPPSPAPAPGEQAAPPTPASGEKPAAPAAAPGEKPGAPAPAPGQQPAQPAAPAR
jgi:membrane fusion protein (multidrug efflux system)